MKVIHISTSLGGGAGLCAKRIIEAERKLGVDARVLIAYGATPQYASIVTNYIRDTRFTLLQRIRRFLYIKGIWPIAAIYDRIIEKELKKTTGSVCFSSPLTLYKGISEHPWVKEADVIHLHWIAGFLDYKSFFKNEKKPIVWTMHDENQGLGGYHYTMWEEKGTPILKKLERKFIKIKKKAYSRVPSMTLVAISSEMQKFIQGNALLQKFPYTKIHNGIEGNVFKMQKKDEARKALGISQDSIVFVFAALQIEDDRKGLKSLIEALDSLKIPQTLLICIGHYNNIPAATFETRCVGFISGPHVQSQYYSAADFFVMPSYQEAFAQTPMEAMACGTPVIAFPCSGTHDLITDGNGIVCKDFTVEGLKEGILKALQTKYNRYKIRENLLMKFSYDKIAKQYIELYEKVLNPS